MKKQGSSVSTGESHILDPSLTLDVKGERLSPLPVDRPKLRNRLLGRLGLGTTVESRASQLEAQRREFFYRVVDQLGEGGYVMGEPELSNVPLLESDYVDFGFKPEMFTDSVHHDDFHKENDPSLDLLKAREGRDWYRIVEDIDGNTTFLKTANKQKRGGGGEGIYELSQMAKHQPEVFASRLGARIGYPVPETRPVYYDGKPWVASPYIKGHEYHTTDVSQAERLSNSSALKTRYLFNMLAGSCGDNSDQGLIDPTDMKYYAQDVSMWLYDGEDNMSDAEVEDKFLRSTKGIRKHDLESLMSYGIVNALTDEDKRFARSFLTAAESITSDEAAEMYAFGHGRFRDSEQIRRIIQRRARVLLSLVESGVLGRASAETETSI